MFRFSSLIATFQRLRNEGFGKIGRSVAGPVTGESRRGFRRSIRLAVFGGCLAGLGAGLFDSRLDAGKKDDEEWSDWEEDSPRKGVKTADGKTSSAKPGGKIQQAQAETSSDDEDDAPTSDFMGIIGRGGHLGFSTFGRNESISPIEFMPYLMVDEHMFFTDFRGFVSNRAQGGGSIGGGYRYLDEPAHAWYGASAWYDIDNSTGYHFQDVGISLEAMIHRVELRGNFYAPVGPDQRLLRRVNSNARFNANQLLFDSATLSGTAMLGFDVEAGYSLPVDLRGVNDQLRGFAGYYHFTGSGVEDINGVKVRAELDLSSTVTTNVQVTHDGTFGTRVMAGMQFNLPWGNKNPASDWRRDMPNPFRYVERNYNVIVSQTSRFEDGVVARDANGNAYVVAHVDSASGGGTGGPTDPFTSVGAAQAGLAGANLFFVHTGSTLNESIALTGAQSLIGEGTGASVCVQGYGSLLLPTLNAGPTPIIDGTGLPVGADAITMTGAGNRVSGFTIQNFSGDGIVANGVSGALIENVSLNGLGGDGVQLNGVTGRVDLAGVAMDTITGRGLFVNGGNANVNVDATFDQVTGDSIRVLNTTGGTVSLTDVGITNGGASGVSLINLVGNFFSNNLDINTVGGDGVYINQGTGTMQFSGLTKITNPGNRGFVIDNSAADVTVANLNVDPPAGPAVVVNQATGEVTFDSLTIEGAAGQRGLVVTDSTDVTVSAGTITTVGAAAIDILNSGVEIALFSVSVDGGPVGIQVVNSTGSLLVSGISAAGSGGTIQNTAQAVLINGFGSTALQRMNITNNVLGISSTGSDLLSLNQLAITGTTGGYAVDSLNDEMTSIISSTFSGNGVVGGGTIQIRATATGTYQSQILGNTITDTMGTAIAYSNSGAAIGASQSISMQQNTINASRANESAIDIAWDGPLGVVFALNNMTLSGSTMVGLDMRELSTTSELSTTVGGNTVTMGGVNSVAFRTEAEDTSNMLFSGNTVTMNGGFGQAFWFDVTDSAQMWIHSNLVNDNGGSGRGINIQNLAANSRLQIDNNRFLFNAGGSSYGIRIENGDPTVQLFGTVTNTITGAATTFAVPVGEAEGSVIINGVTVPAP